jgi:anti-sigma B factor antagonist
MNQEVPQPVNVAVRNGSQPHVTILQISGPLTIRNFFEFQDLTRSEKASVLIVDLSEVPLIDSAALGCLLGLHLSCTKNHRKYGIAGANERLKTMFIVCGIEGVLALFPGVAEAEAALA